MLIIIICLIVVYLVYQWNRPGKERNPVDRINDFYDRDETKDSEDTRDNNTYV